MHFNLCYCSIAQYMVCFLIFNANCSFSFKFFCVKFSFQFPNALNTCFYSPYSCNVLSASKYHKACMSLISVKKSLYFFVSSLEFLRMISLSLPYFFIIKIFCFFREFFKFFFFISLSKLSRCFFPMCHPCYLHFFITLFVY